MPVVTLPVQKLIQVTVTLTQSAAQGPNLNSAMIVGDTPGVIDVATRYRSYEGLSEVAADFGTTAPEYLAAALFYGQNPQPIQLYVGFWAKNATPAYLYCGPLAPSSLLITTWTAITAGAFLVYEDGVPRNVTGLNFSTATNLNAVAATIQTALVALESGSTVVFDAGFERFRFSSGTTGASSTLSFLQTSSAVGSAAFSGQPSAADTLTVDGTAITFVASGATGNEVNIGVNLAATLTSLAGLINASTDVNLSKVVASVVGTTLYMVSKLTGTAGNSYTLAKSSSAITVSGATFAGGTAGTDISTLLVGTQPQPGNPTGAYVADGAAAESALDGVIAIEDVFANWYGLTFAAGTGNADVTDSDHVAVAGYVEGDDNRHLYGLTTAEGAALISGDTASIGAVLHALGYIRTFCQWSDQNPYASTSLLGLGCTVNFDASNSTINFAWKQEPGVVSENLTLSQSDALDANCYNYFAAFNNNTSITVNGQVASGHYIDEIWNADWFASSIQTACYNELFTNPTKVPQTDPGMHSLTVAMEAVCVQGVSNGFLAPGNWNSAGFGQIVQGQFLPNGYYIYQPPISSQSESDRAARKSVAFQIAAKEAGAVNDVQVSVVVNQ